MNNYYIDPKIVALAERAARDLRIFGENGTNTSRRNLTQKQKRLHDFISFKLITFQIKSIPSIFINTPPA